MKNKKEGKSINWWMIFLFVLTSLASLFIGYNVGMENGYNRGCDDVLIVNKDKIRVESTWKK